MSNRESLGIRDADCCMKCGHSWVNRDFRLCCDQIDRGNDFVSRTETCDLFKSQQAEERNDV